MMDKNQKDYFDNKKEFKLNSYGWICPKCGSVLAPHLDTCKFCNQFKDNNYKSINTKTLNNVLNEEMKKKFLDESDSIYEALSKYLEWEKSNSNENNIY